MGIDVEVRVRHKTEVLVFLTVKIECDTVSTDEPWILAHCSWLVAICDSIISYMGINFRKCIHVFIGFTEKNATFSHDSNIYLAETDLKMTINVKLYCIYNKQEF